MSYTERYCHNCYHWEWKGNKEGECGLGSVTCNTAILNHEPSPPPRYLPFEQVYANNPALRVE
mgnify:CR=1 FL=1